MKNGLRGSNIVLWLMIFPFLLYSQTTIEQQLKVVKNDMTVGGDFQIQVQVKGSNLPANNTLGSATIDVAYDNSKLSYQSSSDWAFGFAEGYNRSATDNGTFVRIFITGGGVNQNGGGDPPGFDITTTYTSWVQLNFIIDHASGSTDLTIVPVSNAIGLFENYKNNPNTGVIINQTLSPPENILDESLPVKLTSFTVRVNNGKVNLNWITESEVNTLGFEVWRSNKEIGEYTVVSSYLNNAKLKGQGNSSRKHEYSFVDEYVAYGHTYWYKLADVDFNGNRSYHGSLSVKLEFKDKNITSISENVPKRFKLYQNYPNPFNPETTLRFDIPRLKDGLVDTRIAVYNNLGQLVKTLYDGKLGAGSFEIKWDGKINYGNRACSGVYFVVLKSDFFSQTVKMLLVR